MGSGTRHSASGGPRGLLTSEFVAYMLRDFRQGGKQAIAKVRKHNPAVYLKVLALMMPKEHKVEHSGGVSTLTDDQLDAAIEALQGIIAAQAAGPAASPGMILEGEVIGAMTALPPPRQRVPSPSVRSPRRRKPRMRNVGQAVGRGEDTSD